MTDILIRIKGITIAICLEWEELLAKGDILEASASARKSSPPQLGGLAVINLGEKTEQSIQVESYQSFRMNSKILQRGTGKDKVKNIGMSKPTEELSAPKWDTAQMSNVVSLRIPFIILIKNN